MHEPEGTPVEYVCAECGAKCERTETGFLRECNHSEAGVQANLTATVVGEGAMAN